MGRKILIIDDDKPTSSMMRALLEKRGFDAHHADGAQSGLRMAYQLQPDLVMLEVALPDRDGLEVCRQLRQLSDMPIILISASQDNDNLITGLEIGADDYIAKPIDHGELIARIKARLRRSPKARHIEELAFNGGEFRINFVNREVWIGDALKQLTPKEFNLLAVLAQNAGRVVPRGELVAEAWGDDYRDAVDTLKLYIHYLRQKLETNPQQPQLIVTSRGVGYRFAPN